VTHPTGRLPWGFGARDGSPGRGDRQSSSLSAATRFAGARAFVAFTLRWGRLLWVAALLLAVPATWRTAQLYGHLRSEIEDLLPSSAPSVIALGELRGRLPGVMHLGVIVDSGDAEHLPAATRLIDDLAVRVRGYPADLVRSVRTGDAVERRFIEDHAPLYVDLDDLRTIRDRIEARRDWRVSKDQGTLLDEDQPPPRTDLQDILARYQERANGGRHFDGDHFASKELHLALLLVELERFDTGRSRAEQLLDRVKHDVADLGPDRYAPGMRVGFTSDIAIHVEERRALLSDLSISSVAVVVLVAAVIVFYYRWWPSIVLLLAPLLLATVFAFALASLPPFGVTDLNSNTAFLGSILVGNGINFGIILLARYVEERRRGAAAQEALVVAIGGARKGTLSAALAAGASYASLALSDFRGFRQFGLIGGLGMLLAWAFAFVLMPPLTLWVDRTPELPRLRRNVAALLAGWLERRRTPVIVISALLAVLAVWRVRTFGSTLIETDFSKLRRADTWQTGEGYWGRRMDALLGSYVTPTVILADDPAQARAIGQRLEAEARESPLDRMVARVRTLDDLVPRDQSEKIEIARQIRDDLSPSLRASLAPDERALIERLLGPAVLSPVTPADLPESLGIGLREHDGSMGRTVLVYPRPTHLLWEGPPLADFVMRLRAAAGAARPPGRPAARVASSLALSADILDRVRRDGVTTSLVAFCSVVVVVLALLRARESAALVLGSLLLGVLWLTASIMVLGVKINFVNFIAFPITFGIGVDYAVNLASRWELDRGRTMFDALRATGGAVALCSSTTVIGYSSLLLAQNRALFLFGVLAVLGEVACLAAALVVLPTFVSLFVGHTRSSGLTRRA
jgi:uncharacterized protein